jgi:hypothetical protein
MVKASKLAKIGVVLAVGIILLSIFFSIKTCTKKPASNPAVDRLHEINDSLYEVIQENNRIANDLYEKLDSITIISDTIIQRQEITNKYYKNEVYNILSSTDADANTQFRSTLKKSDSLLKSGFYTKTYDLRSAANESKLH